MVGVNTIAAQGPEFSFPVSVTHCESDARWEGRYLLPGELRSHSLDELMTGTVLM